MQVRQYFASKENDSDPVLANLDGTNGRMLSMMIEHTVAVHQLDANVQRTLSLINLLKEGMEMHAIIDCGALLAGVDLYELSTHILSFLHVKNFGGVLFYDSVRHNECVILERSGRILRKDISPIKEDNVFAIFDEPRCRGTDLKLRFNTVALMTLAPKICKDKIMQAAGRLRRLGRSQKLVIAGGADVFSKLPGNSASSSCIPSWGEKKCFDASVLQVLAWAMKNTVDATAVGLLNWSNQCLFFASTFDKNPKLSITDELLELQDMYGKPFVEQTVLTLSSDAYQYHMKRTGGEKALHGSVKGMVDLMQKQVNEYGKEFTFSARGCDEECERELEMEIEEEEELEVEVPMMTPLQERSWDYTSALSCQSPTQLSSIAGIKALSTVIATTIKPASVAKIKWCKKLYCTNNFAQTITSQDKSSFNRFLRVVNFLLSFPNGDHLLLSEFEANSFLKLLWDYNTRPPKEGPHLLVHSCFLRHSLDNMTEISLQCTTQKSGYLSKALGKDRRIKADSTISDISMASLQLFAGETSYETEKRKEALKSILRIRKSSEALFCPRAETERLVEMRGLAKLYPYSVLEAVGNELLCEL